jgi:putative ABC transport system permease protein
MLKNYLKVAFRNISRQKFYSFLNVLGLTIGIASSLLIVLYVQDEISYDKFHESGANIYRANLRGRMSGQEINVAVSCPPMAAALVQEIPEVQSALRMVNTGSIIVKYENKSFNEQTVVFADSNFFQFFSFPLVSGDPANALKEPNTLVITERAATKYFGNEPAMGKLLSIGSDTTTYLVTGVAADPSHSHFDFDFVLSGTSAPQFKDPIWLNNYIYTYLKLNDGASADAVKAKIDALTLKYIGPEVQRFMGLTMEQFKEQGSSFGYALIPLFDIHLKSPYDAEPMPQGDMQYVILFSAIAVFILIIASINFMNLATARSAGRAKEVGLRKTLGSLSKHLVIQFLSESFVFTLLSAVFALGMVYMLLPYFNEMAGKELVFEGLLSSQMLLITAGVVVIVGLLAGSYPAFYLTSFKVTEVLKGKAREGMKGGAIRSGLVVFQFFVSIFLIICTLVIFQQMQYAQNKNLGLDREKVLILSNANQLSSSAEAFKNAVQSESGVVAASYTNSVPAVNTEGASIFRTEGSEEDHLLVRYFADYDQINAMGYELKEGRYFSRDFPSDSSAIVVNESVLKEMGWSEGVGKELWGFNGGGRVRYSIIGVVKDFNYENLRTKVRPMIMFLGRTGNYLTVRFNNDPREAVSRLETLWQKYAGNEPFEYSFLDEDFDELFRAEQRMGYLFTTFTVLAIVIACLGLIGLAAFTAEKRTKELGIRKVLGASELSLIGLLSREFVALILVALGLAVFPAWYFATQWLQGFAYRISLSYWVFALAGVVAVVVALACVSFQALRAARLNPAKSLRYE